MVIEQRVFQRFRQAFPVGEGWWRWNDRRKKGRGAGDCANWYERFVYVGREGPSIYFPIGEDHAHITQSAVRSFGTRAEALQHCLNEVGVPLGCEGVEGDPSTAQWVVHPQHADAIIEVLREGP